MIKLETVDKGTETHRYFKERDNRIHSMTRIAMSFFIVCVFNMLSGHTSEIRGSECIMEQMLEHEE